MTRMNPFRRLAATAAIVGVTGFGAVALAGPALADTTAPAATSSTTAVAPSTQSISMSELLAGLFSTAKTVGSLDLTKIQTLTPLTIDDLTGIFSSTANASPLPTGPVQLKVGALKLSLAAPVAQKVQTVLANFYVGQGYQIAFNDKGVLVIGSRICDLTKSADWNKDCVTVNVNARF